MRPRTAFSPVTTRAPIFFARSQSAALLMLASGAIVVTSVPFRLRMPSMVMASSVVWWPSRPSHLAPAIGRPTAYRFPPPCEIGSWEHPPHPRGARAPVSKDGVATIRFVVRDTPCGAPHHEETDTISICGRLVAIGRHAMESVLLLPPASAYHIGGTQSASAPARPINWLAIGA